MRILLKFLLCLAALTAQAQPGYEAVVVASNSEKSIPAQYEMTAANTAVFDGSTTYGSRDTVTAGVLSSGKVVTFNFWVNFAGGNGTAQIVFMIGTTTSPQLYCRKATDNLFQFIARDNAGGVIINCKNSTAVTASSGWQHVNVCLDTSAKQNCKIYLNGVAETIAYTTFSTNAIMDLAQPAAPRCRMGALQDGLEKLNGTLAEFWLDDVLLDNPGKFRGGTGKPLFLGNNGDIPTGNQPAIYLSGNGSGSAWLTDSSGRGNTYTATGTINSGTPP